MIYSWVIEMSGIYSVRSAYRMLIRNASLNSDDASCSNAEGDGVWTKLWNLAVVPKIRVFSWPVVKDLLPCYSKLTMRLFFIQLHASFVGLRRRPFFML
jgi:hypothetical protein